MKSILVGILATAGLTFASAALAADIPLLARKSNCSACHSIDKKLVGPAWMDISMRYKNATSYTYNGKEYPLQEGLIMKVSRGGSGNWGTIPMPANAPAIKEADIKAIVIYVLGLAKK